MSMGYDLGFMGYKRISAIIFGEYMDEFDKNLTRDVFLRNMFIWGESFQNGFMSVIFRLVNYYHEKLSMKNEGLIMTKKLSCKINTEDQP